MPFLDVGIWECGELFEEKFMGGVKWTMFGEVVGGAFVVRANCSGGYMLG